MSITPAFALLAGEIVARWRNRVQMARTRRIVSSLPHRIRKDIGWPETSLPERQDRHWL